MTAKIASPLIGLVWAVALSTAAFACAFDQTLDADFNLDHPRAMETAVALSRFHAGEPPRPAVVSEGMAGYWRVSAALGALGDRLRPVAGRPGFALLLVDVSLWTLYQANGAVEIHAPDARDMPTSVLTDHLVLDGLASGEISITDALARGIVTVEGRDQEAVRAALQRAFSTPSTARPLAGRSAFGAKP
jgi:hypothetical protein